MSNLSILFCVVRTQVMNGRKEDVLINAFPCKPQADALCRNQQSGKLYVKAITDKAQIWKTLNRLGKN